MKLLSEQAYNYLKNLIITNQLEHDVIYSETKLSKELGISRTPFRDAIHRLATESYIDIIPSKGFKLHKLNSKDVYETLQIRSALECYCTMKIAETADSIKALDLFDQLEFALLKMKQILETDRSIERFCKFDFLFHTAIISYIDNQHFIESYRNFQYRMQKLATLSLTHKNRMEETYNEHCRIYNTLRSGDTSNIYQYTLEHLENPVILNLSDLEENIQ